MSGLSIAIKEFARELGFSAAGIVPATPSPHLDSYLKWIERGMHGSMGYMARPDRVARHQDLTLILPNARSLIVVAFDYINRMPTRLGRDRSRGRISNYAWGADYHKVMVPRLKVLAEVVRDAESTSMCRTYVDTGAILERSHAARAQLGFIGKNTMLIHPRRGSYFFLGEIVTTLDLEYDEPIASTTPGCGTCTRCLIACPTHALVGPYILDARKCISYLTIEHKGTFDRELRPRVGNWVYGCDICQDVCPWQRFAAPTGLVEFESVDIQHVAPSLATLLAMSVEQFDQTYRGTPIHRIGRDKLVSNACIAAGNSADEDLSKLLIPLLRDADQVVRSHAAWALSMLGQGEDALSHARAVESDPGVKVELEAALNRKIELGDEQHCAPVSYSHREGRNANQV